ncbi:family 78 glycoside hydrolase catalytic domain [Agreia sp. Leaf283]|uniref:family 78 glycoside hydrolase catalytic domain n=1 Tax=Agreia sp. Leaf283 TaxID=1736321 RepID=UPI0006FA0C2E|nr:family 78 glycoside hydrolase catalytic domain [Agreia sp. Leaf283]KQP56016.1 alpha-L-rhamnosidase [Agreia sp. Leaf283]
MASLTPPTAPRFEHRTDPGDTLGLGTGTPRLSWTVATAPDDYVQSGYDVEVSRPAGVTVFAVESAEQVLVPWPADALHSRERASVRVRVRAAGYESDWSPARVVEAGLLEVEDWSAGFISPRGIGGLHQPAPELQGSIVISGEIASARLFATAHGIMSARINGVPADDTVLAPGWTAYQDRLRYRAYDVTALVQNGLNQVTVLLGNGWWRGRFGFLGERALYGDTLALLAQLEVTTTDGLRHTLSTDGTWRARATGILADDIYDGQITDLRFDDRTEFTVPVDEVAGNLRTLAGEDGPPMRVVETLQARRVWSSPSGKTLVDFGQNVVGWMRLRVHSRKAGTEVTLRHAEVLENGELGIEPLRSAKATDTFFIRGDDEEILEPSLTFHGFRYAEIEGLDGIEARDLEAIVISSDLQRTGWFDSSHELLNRFHENVVWGMRGNFLSVPTDCPQRDERLGWTGDIQVFTPTATYLFDSAGFLDSWLKDLAAEQSADGTVPHVIPDILRTPLTSAPAAAWGDAATVVPWTLWQRTGDTGVLARQFDSMRGWVDRLNGIAGPDLIWRGGFQYGDWLDPTAPFDDPAAAKADPDVVATAHFAKSAQLVADAALELGRADEGAHYGLLARQVREAFVREFVTGTGRVLSDSQTAYAMALQWDLVTDSDQRLEAGNRLADLVRGSAFRIATGFVGTPIICDALTDTGHADLAHRLLFQTSAPSWLYPVTMDATTVWERWDSLLPDGTINPSGMTSFNHYALGSVVDWVHRRVAGLAPSAPGYRGISVRPLPPAQLTSASARHITPYGEARVAWRREGGVLTLDVTVPVGTTADVELPWNAGEFSVSHGQHRWEIPAPELTIQATSTIRDLIDDEQHWARFTALALGADLAPNELRLAQLLSSYLNHPVASLVDGVWTKGWPSESAKKELAAFVRSLTSPGADNFDPLDTKALHV